MRIRTTAGVLLSCLSFGVLHAQSAPTVDVLLGTWRGTSTCADRVAAPACQDETVVYEFRRASTPGHAILAADKIVNEQRVPMGELEFAWDPAEACWRSDFESPRVKSRWCFTMEGEELKGTARLLPGNQVIRRVDVKRAPR